MRQGHGVAAGIAFMACVLVAVGSGFGVELGLNC